MPIVSGMVIAQKIQNLSEMNPEVVSESKLKKLMLNIDDTKVAGRALSVTNATVLMAVLSDCVISTDILESYWATV